MEEVYLFELTRPWWEIVVRASVIYAGLFLAVRVLGKRQIGKFTAFDFIFVMLLGAAVGRAMIGGDRSLTAAGIAVGTLIILNAAITWAAGRWKRIDRFAEGKPELLLRAGRVDYSTLRRTGVTNNDLLAALRAQGCETPADADWVVLETSGEITVKKHV